MARVWGRKRMYRVLLTAPSDPQNKGHLLTLYSVAGSFYDSCVTSWTIYLNILCIFYRRCCRTELQHSSYCIVLALSYFFSLSKFYLCETISHSPECSLEASGDRR